MTDLDGMAEQIVRLVVGNITLSKNKCRIKKQRQIEIILSNNHIEHLLILSALFPFSDRKINLRDF